MQKHIRSGIGEVGRVNPRSRIYTEALNPHFGYFYTVKKSLHKVKTKFQEIELIETDEFGKVLLLDNITQLCERNEYQYHEPMVHPALICHPKPKSVLVIGGGDGGVVREVLKYPTVQRVALAELDEGVIAFSRKYLSTIHNSCFDDPRLQINIVDGKKYAQAHAGEFDVIIMDMTDPFGPSKMLYTRDFFRVVKRALRNEHGIFVMHSESPISRPQAFACIQKTLKTVFTQVNPLYLYIQMYAVLWSISVCSPHTDISVIRPTTIDRKLSRYNIAGLHVFNGATHRAMQTAYPYIQELFSLPARVITDKAPDFPDDFISTKEGK